MANELAQEQEPPVDVNIVRRYHPNSKEQLSILIEAMRREADRYEALLKSLPDGMSIEAEEALCRMVNHAWKSPL